MSSPEFDFEKYVKGRNRIECRDLTDSGKKKKKKGGQSIYKRFTTLVPHRFIITMRIHTEFFIYLFQMPVVITGWPKGDSDEIEQ